MARFMPGAGPPSRGDNARAPVGAAGGENNVNMRRSGVEARPSDLSEAFASELDRIPSGQPTAGLNAFNRAYHAAKTSDARDQVNASSRIGKGAMTRVAA